jgi:hypothetical protein
MPHESFGFEKTLFPLPTLIRWQTNQMTLT